MRVFITGMTGTLGTALAELHASRADSVFGCARNESRAVEWMRVYGKRATLYVADALRLADSASDIGRLLPSIDRVYHCAALKHVDVCQANPEETCVQNVSLVAAVAAVCGPRMVFVSSDKACLPQGVYGASKLIAETLATSRGAAAVRLGNLIGSSGSVFHVWKRQAVKGEPITLTDPEMTRYFVPVEEGARFVADFPQAERVVVPSLLRAVRIGDVANALGGPNVELTGPRGGETRHQWLVSPGERVKRGREHFVLGSHYNETLVDGLSSEKAPWWDVNELLRVAGIAR